MGATIIGLPTFHLDRQPWFFTLLTSLNFRASYATGVEAIIRTAEKEGNIGERYILGKVQITVGEYYDTVAELAHVPPPSMELPGWMTMFNARMLTALANVTKQPPWLGMSVDQMRTFKEGYVCDGSKAERELGITYTPIREGLAEEVEQALKTPA